MASLAFCGVHCEDCLLFQATESGDFAALAGYAVDLSLPGSPLCAEDLTCRGCHSREGVHAKSCRECVIRRCAQQRVKTSCAECHSFPCWSIQRLVPLETDSSNELEFAHACGAGASFYGLTDEESK